MTPKQREIIKALGLTETEARNLRVHDLFDQARYIGPPAAREIVEKYINWRRIQLKKGKHIDPNTYFFVRRSRLRLEDNYLAKAELKKLFRIMKEQSGRQNAYRDRFLILLMYRTALRVNEVHKLNVADLVVDEYLDVHNKLLIKGKGGRLRTIPLLKETRDEIRKFLKWKIKRGESVDLDAPLFISCFHKRLSIRQMQQTVSNWIRRAGINKITAHGLRHTSLTHLCHNSSKGILVAQRIAGHSQLSTTQRYLHLSPDDYSSALEGLL